MASISSSSLTWMPGMGSCPKLAQTRSAGNGGRVLPRNAPMNVAREEAAVRGSDEDSRYDYLEHPRTR